MQPAKRRRKSGVRSSQVPKHRPKRSGRFGQSFPRRKPLKRRETGSAGQTQTAPIEGVSRIQKYMDESRQIEVLARKFGDEIVRRFSHHPHPIFLEERRIRRRLAWCFLRQMGGDKPGAFRNALRSLVLLNDNLLSLTRRQRAIASGLIRGLETKEIAAELKMAPYTVKQHIDNMMLKAHVDNRTKLARWCLAI